MGDRTFKAFAPTFLITFAGMAGAWFAIDALAHLDDLIEISGPDAHPLGMAARLFSGVIRLLGGMPIAVLALASAAGAAIATRKASPRSGSLG